MSDQRTRFPFQHVDVFTSLPFKGNPVAACSTRTPCPPRKCRKLRAGRISRRPHSSARRRARTLTIACASSPLDPSCRSRATHLGSAWAVLASGSRPESPGILVQECAKGLATLRQVEDELFFSARTRLRHR